MKRLFILLLMAVGDVIAQTRPPQLRLSRGLLGLIIILCVGSHLWGQPYVASVANSFLFDDSDRGRFNIHNIWIRLGAKSVATSNHLSVAFADQWHFDDGAGW